MIVDHFQGLFETETLQTEISPNIVTVILFICKHFFQGFQTQVSALIITQSGHWKCILESKAPHHDT